MSEWSLFGKITAWAIGLTVVSCCCVIVALMFKPAFLGFERQAYKQSHQYVETKESQLLQWVDEYYALGAEIAKYQADNEDEHYNIVIAGLQSQQLSLETRIEIEAQRIPDGALPPSVEDFISTH